MSTYVKWRGTKKWHKVGEDSKTQCGETLEKRKGIEVAIITPPLKDICGNCRQGD